MNLISKEKCRSFRRFIKFSWFLSLCFMTHAQTSIMISGNFSEEKQVTIFDELKKITWSSKGIGEGKQKDNSSESFKDVKRVQEYLDANHITATAAYVPTTVWDLYFIYKYFKDQDFQERCFLVPKKNDEKEFPRIYFQISQELFNRMHSHQKSGSQKDLAFFTRFGETMLESIATEFLVERLFGKNEWIKALICEYEKIKDNKSSLILEMIQQEYQAAQKNQILLVRATNGLPLQSKVSTKQEAGDLLRRHITVSIKPEKTVEETINDLLKQTYRLSWFDCLEWFQTFNSDQKALDFPLKNAERLYHSAYEEIHDFNKSDDALRLSANLSYATSLLAGYLYDGLDKNVSACSFAFYVKNPELTLYTLSLDKKWFFTEGATFFHAGDHPLIGILGEGESFHPRLRAIVASVKTNNESEEPWFPERETLTRCFKLDDSFDWSGFNENIQRNPEKKRIFQYVLKANEILSSASILSLGGKLTSRDRFAKEKAKQMIENQKRCSDVLIEKCKGTIH